VGVAVQRGLAEAAAGAAARRREAVGVGRSVLVPLQQHANCPQLQCPLLLPSSRRLLLRQARWMRRHLLLLLLLLLLLPPACLGGVVVRTEGLLREAVLVPGEHMAGPAARVALSPLRKFALHPPVGPAPQPLQLLMEPWQ
jgi:hypothetical protein